MTPNITGTGLSWRLAAVFFGSFIRARAEGAGREFYVHCHWGNLSKHGRLRLGYTHRLLSTPTRLHLG